MKHFLGPYLVFEHQQPAAWICFQMEDDQCVQIHQAPYGPQNKRIKLQSHCYFYEVDVESSACYLMMENRNVFRVLKRGPAETPYVNVVEKFSYAQGTSNWRLDHNYYAYTQEKGKRDVLQQGILIDLSAFPYPETQLLRDQLKTEYSTIQLPTLETMPLTVSTKHEPRLTVTLEEAVKALAFSDLTPFQQNLVVAYIENSGTWPFSGNDSVRWLEDCNAYLECFSWKYISQLEPPSRFYLESSDVAQNARFSHVYAFGHGLLVVAASMLGRGELPVPECIESNKDKRIGIESKRFSDWEEWLIEELLAESPTVNWSHVTSSTLCAMYSSLEKISKNDLGIWHVREHVLTVIQAQYGSTEPMASERLNQRLSFLKFEIMCYMQVSDGVEAARRRDFQPRSLDWVSSISWDLDLLIALFRYAQRTAHLFSLPVIQHTMVEIFKKHGSNLSAFIEAIVLSPELIAYLIQSIEDAFSSRNYTLDDCVLILQGISQNPQMLCKPKNLSKLLGALGMHYHYSFMGYPINLQTFLRQLPVDMGLLFLRSTQPIKLRQWLMHTPLQLFLHDCRDEYIPLIISFFYAQANVSIETATFEMLWASLSQSSRNSILLGIPEYPLLAPFLKHINNLEERKHILLHREDLITNLTELEACLMFLEGHEGGQYQLLYSAHSLNLLSPHLRESTRDIFFERLEIWFGLVRYQHQLARPHFRPGMFESYESVYQFRKIAAEDMKKWALGEGLPPQTFFNTGILDKPLQYYKNRLEAILGVPASQRPTQPRRG